MDFISNLIKRPISSLVINDTEDSVDKFSTTESAASMPSNLIENPKIKKSPGEDREISHSKNNVALNMSSSCHSGDNIANVVGVPQGYLGEFEDILPPPPPRKIYFLDAESTQPLSVTSAPSPPPLTKQESETILLTPSMKASQTIDELLSHINDNLQQAGLNDDVLAIASQLNKLELNPSSGKAVLSNSKLSTPSTTYTSALPNEIPANIPKKPTTNAGTAITVFENNSSLHKFQIDPELETGFFDDHHQGKQHLEVQHQHKATSDPLNTAGLNKLPNKFMGLTEFDETKIPELPGDLNPNIEEQYNITFEECLIPTLTAQQEIKVPDEFGSGSAHLLLPTEVDTISSDNETFADCNDGKDTLATTFSETGNTDVPIDLDSYRSAVNDTINEINVNDTMENITEIGREAEAYPLQKPNESLVMHDYNAGHNQQYENMQEEEPMDIDMNSTIEIIQNTSNNIQNVEKVLQHAENILQQMEEKSPTKDSKQETKSLENNTAVECPCKNVENIETEYSKFKLTPKKSIELTQEAKNLSSVCIVKETKNETNELHNSKTDVTNNLNVNVDNINSSVNSSSPTKSSSDVRGESRANFTPNSSITYQKSSDPSSPSFPIKQLQNEGFPRSPIPLVNKQSKPHFLEKSHNSPTQILKENPIKTNENFLKECSQPEESHDYSSVDSNSNENSRETVNADNGEYCQKTSGKEELLANAAAFKIESEKNELQTFLVNTRAAEEKRRTFSIQSDASQHTTLQFPVTVDKSADIRRTFSVTEMCTEHEDISNTVNREAEHTSNVNLKEKDAKQITMNTSIDSTDINDNTSEIIKLNLAMPYKEDQLRSQPNENFPTVQQMSQPVVLPALRQYTKSSERQTLQQNSTSPPLPLSPNVPELQQKSQSPPLPSIQKRPESPAVRAMLYKSQSPPATTLQNRSQTPPLNAVLDQTPKIQPVQASSLQLQSINIKEEKTSPTINPQSQPLPKLIQKRPSIRDIRNRPDILSAKEQSNIKVKDEKDVIVEKSSPSPVENVFTAVSATSTIVTNSSACSELEQTSSSSTSLINKNSEQIQEQFEEEFGGNNIIFNPSDFDYLLTKGNNNKPVARSSLLLKFDPFLGVSVPVDQGPQQQQQLQQQVQLQIPTNTINPCLSPTLEEDEHNDSNRSFVVEKKSSSKTSIDGVVGGLTENSAKLPKEGSQEAKQQLQFGPLAAQQNKNFLKQGVNKKNATMSVDVIKDMSLDNDCNKTFENSNSTQSDDKQNNYKMDELEKKIKNEVLKTEDIEKKLKDAEQREEALIKRITEKDKTVAKMTGVIEAYEKAIAELIAEKEQLIQNYEKQLAEVKADRDSNYHHLTSLETTFSDLHVKYEKSKEMTCQLKASEEALQAEKRKNLENLHLQEQRYDKMKNHAMQQLEIANKKLESLTRDHSIEITKLKALLKKEEIARSSINEQLAQKTKENAELVKICDELIANQGS